MFLNRRVKAKAKNDSSDEDDDTDSDDSTLRSRFLNKSKNDLNHHHIHPEMNIEMKNDKTRFCETRKNFVSGERYFAESTDFDDGLNRYDDDNNPQQQSAYDSDHIDPDLEQLLYASIHHQTIDTIELAAAAAADSKLSNFESSTPLSSSTFSHPSLSTTNDRSTASSICGNYSIHNNRETFRNETIIPSGKIKRSIHSPSTIPCNIAYGNLSGTSDMIGANESTNRRSIEHEELMEKFYNEDSNDSEEDARVRRRMPDDHRFWHVDAADLMRRRCSGNSGNSGRLQCRFCGGTGHLVKNCTKKKMCYLCCDTRHIATRCKVRQCAICFERGHQSNRCEIRYELKSAIRCAICGIAGHEAEQCTSHWRKFLTITDEITYEKEMNNSNNNNNDNRNRGTIAGDIVTINHSASCLNCGARGHWGFECRQKTIDNQRGVIPAPVLNWNEIRRAKNRDHFAASQRAAPKFAVNNQPAVRALAPATASNRVAAKRKRSWTEMSLDQFPDIIELDTGPSKKVVPPEVIDLVSSSSTTSSSSSGSEDDDNSNDSDDSLQYVLNLLKQTSGEINDSPLPNNRNRPNAKKKKTKLNNNNNYNNKQQQQQKKKKKIAISQECGEQNGSIKLNIGFGNKTKIKKSQKLDIADNRTSSSSSSATRPKGLGRGRKMPAAAAAAASTEVNQKKMHWKRKKWQSNQAEANHNRTSELGRKLTTLRDHAGGGNPAKKRNRNRYKKWKQK